VPWCEVLLQDEKLEMSNVVVWGFLPTYGTKSNEQREGRKSANITGLCRFSSIIVKSINYADNAQNNARHQKTHNNNNRLFHNYVFFLAFWGFVSSVCTSMSLFYPINGCQASGGWVYLDSGTFRLVTGTIYGSNEADTSLKNTATDGAALFKGTNGTAQRGTFSGTGGAWVSSGDLATTNDTIRVVEGELQ
jgi:hypothetical protein